MSTRDERRLPGRLETLLPLVIAYLGLAALYAWQASVKQTVTLFSDEIEFTQISRSIAETGHAALRGGDPAPGASLYAWLAAPAWWLDDVKNAYEAIKLIGVLVMTATIFPAYALARIVVSHRYAVFAAVGAVAAPALAYAPFLVDEPLAYPVSTAGLYLIARAALAPTRWSVGAALVTCVVATLVRSQLAILFVVFALVLVAGWWRGDAARRWRARWSAWDWIGAAVLIGGVAVLASAVLGRHSFSWYVSTAFYKQRMLEYGLWAFGALIIGIGVLPFVAAVAGLVGARGSRRDDRTATFVALTVAAIAAFAFYTAIKAAYLSTYFAVVTAERNLIYLVPLLFAATALLLEHRRSNVAATVAATVVAAYLVSTTPHSLASYPNYEAHGLSIAAFANRILRWPAERIETTLIVVAVVSGLAVVALHLARSRRVTAVVAAVVVGFTLTWSLTTEIYAAHGEKLASDRQYSVLATPPSWIDSLTGGQPTLFVGQGITDPNPVWQLEFWNRSLKWFWGMDGSAPGPGARATPNLVRVDGTHDPVEIGARYAVAVNGVNVNGRKLTTVGGATLYDVGGKPVRLSDTTTGISPDGWMGKNASYTRYAVKDDPKGLVVVNLSREAACFPKLEPVHVSARVGPVIVDKFDQPAIGHVTATRDGVLDACKATGLALPVPKQPWRVEVKVAETFVPRELDSTLGDARSLGARVNFGLSPLEP